MSLRILFISNPKSHLVSKYGSVLKAISTDIVHNPNIKFLNLSNFNTLQTDVEVALSNDCDAIFIEGGDGTVLAVLSACFLCARNKALVLPPVAIIAGGSTNLAYKVLGFKPRNRTKLEKKILNLLEYPERMKTKDQSVLLVSSSLQKDAPHAGFLLSVGSLARAMLYTQDALQGDKRGSVDVAKAAIRLGFTPSKAIFSDGEQVIRPAEFSEIGKEDYFQEVGTTFALFSSLEQLSLGLKPFWNRRAFPIGFTHGKWPLRRLKIIVAKLFAGLSGGHLEKHGIDSRGCESISFRCNGPVVLDGETLDIPDDQTFHVSASQPVRFIQ